jgi:uncharacterized protein (UPF0332 family)
MFTDLIVVVGFVYSTTFQLSPKFSSKAMLFLKQLDLRGRSGLGRFIHLAAI